MLAQLLALPIYGKQLTSWLFFIDHEYGFVAATALGLVLASLFYGLLWAIHKMIDAYRAETRAALQTARSRRARWFSH